MPARKKTRRTAPKKKKSSSKPMRTSFLVLLGVGLVLGLVFLWVIGRGGRAPEMYEQKCLDCCPIERCQRREENCLSNCRSEHPKGDERQECLAACRQHYEDCIWHPCSWEPSGPSGGGGSGCWCVGGAQCPSGWPRHTGADYGCAQKPAGQGPQDVYCCPPGVDPGEGSPLPSYGACTECCRLAINKPCSNIEDICGSYKFSVFSILRCCKKPGLGPGCG